MGVNLRALEGRAKDFNSRYGTAFSYSKFLTRAQTCERLGAKNAADVVYKGFLANVLKEAVIKACSKERDYSHNSTTTINLQTIADEYETYLIQPYIQECIRGKEKLRPKPLGGMTEKEKIALIEKVINSSPKNDVDLLEKAYLNGKIRIREMRQSFKDINISVNLSKKISDEPGTHIATMVLALEKVNKSRSSLWKFFHPFRNNAEQREARDMRAALNALGENVFERSQNLALSEYKTITLTRKSIESFKTKLIENIPSVKPEDIKNVNQISKEGSVHTNEIKKPSADENDNRISMDIKFEDKKDDVITKVDNKTKTPISTNGNTKAK